jgi:hypothetical protein
MHLTNVRLARRHHWLFRACLPLHYGFSSERLLLLAEKAHDFGPRGVPFTALHPHPSCMSSSAIIFLDAFSPSNDYAVMLHTSHAHPILTYLSADLVLGPGLSFRPLRKLTPPNISELG